MSTTRLMSLLGPADRVTPKNGRTARRRVVHALLAVGTAAVLAGTATASTAADGPVNVPGVHTLNSNQHNEFGPSCPQGWFCIWGSYHLKYGSYALLPGADAPRVEDLRFANEGSMGGVYSWVNNSPVTYCGFEGNDYTGTKTTLKPFETADTSEYKSVKVC
ncbi:peptidase inhibitor family I36 protein [Streptomyces clavuligerus]|uniref:Peptidase inhibitor family I36 n=1 Tax=Streptomyces clavuligerus TaxID=1901 RepID=B5GML9_STRCL|nr:peptidase inhibitor family I36 protein [Streptomyces clavuligerus]ANW22419.1 hypothetical protein BB341_29295 [Streptomyces clavuligerus]AXU17324.1 hypothetical protein D1794_32420 [Streptomyces clavuligerus]EDY47565.1 hypothetical protein SSCG_00593 [Streptomyces clavuligerus]EFG04523.1 Hypothetical protein SCLAV_p1037 [Streptomyces clavuligerus]MBY6307026.1 peptidase inhibitor family I36 protein [Streptomyces clavuligerus]